MSYAETLKDFLTNCLLCEKIDDNRIFKIIEYFTTSQKVLIQSSYTFVIKYETFVNSNVS